LDALLVEVGNDVGRVRDGAEQAIQLGHDYGSLTLDCGGEELAAGGTAGEGLAAAESGIREDFGQVKSFHGAVGGDALALGFETEATVGLFFAGHTDVTEGVFHGVYDCYFTPGRGRKSRGEGEVNRGADGPVDTGS
jgi:hypothetical protein